MESIKTLTDDQIRARITELETAGEDYEAFQLLLALDKRIARRTKNALRAHRQGNADRLAKRLS